MIQGFKAKETIGILGGGQLALMIGNAAVRMGLKPIVFAENSWDPAARAHPDTVFGSINEAHALIHFFSKTKKIVIENEFLDCQLLRDTSLSPRPDSKEVQFFPSLETLQILQDKLQQKRLLERLDIPSAEYRALDLTDCVNLRSELKALLASWSQDRCVLKWSRLGYDGKGVFFVRMQQLDQESELAKIEAFCQQGMRNGGKVFVERAISFRRELALIGVRSITGEFAAYPLVISEQKNGICHRVYGPAMAFQVTQEKESQARQFARNLAESIGFIGTFALEFFEADDGRLLVNEIAPRVHNSGHYTQDACATDQFENHLRAVLGLPLGATDSAPAFAMLNLLGPEGVVISEDQLPLPIPGSRSHLHWYGKRDMKPGRKMGHLNAVFSATADVSTVGAATAGVATAVVSKMGELMNELDQSYLNWVASLSGQSGADQFSKLG